jgi:hypothetical protein
LLAPARERHCACSPRSRNLTSGQFLIRSINEAPWRDRLIKKAAAARRLIFTDHALDEMDADGETRESVASVLRNASAFTLQENGRWRVHGEGLTVIVQIAERAVIVWTVFAG